jgi:hypothetical protein
MCSLLCVRKIAAHLLPAACSKEMTERTGAHHSGNMDTLPIQQTRVAQEFGIFSTGTDDDACCGIDPRGNGGGWGEIERSIS